MKKNHWFFVSCLAFSAAVLAYSSNENSSVGKNNKSRWVTSWQNAGSLSHPDEGLSHSAQSSTSLTGNTGSTTQ